MVFVPIKDVLNSWLDAERFKKVIQERQVINWANRYFEKNKKWPPHIIKAIAFSNQGRLIIQCCQGVISSEMRLEELNFKKYLKEHVPQAQIKQIFYKIK